MNIKKMNVKRSQKIKACKKKKRNTRKMIMSDEFVINPNNSVFEEEDATKRTNDSNAIKFTKITAANDFLKEYCGLKRSETKKIENKKDIEELLKKHNYFGYYNCGCFLDEYETFFCPTHRREMYDNATVEELINYASPPFQQNIPLPDHAWREKYPLGLRKIEFIETLCMKNCEMKVLHHSPYQTLTKTLHVCDQCLSEYPDLVSYKRHLIKCETGYKGKCIYKEIQTKNYLCVYEIDGEKEKKYCRRLCMVGKFFLDHKTLFYDVDAFLFYTLYVDSNFIGFFSKEKVSTYNLSCIVVLPAHQGKGYGYFLVDLSYALSIANETVGTPEKPLSSKGLAVYKNYWMCAVYTKIMTLKDDLIIENMSKELGMTCNDVVYALEALGFIKNSRDGYLVEAYEKSLPIVRRVNRKCLTLR